MSKIKRKFISILVFLLIIAVFLSSCATNEAKTTLPSGVSQEPQKQAPQESTKAPKEILGWWKEIESPIYKEFTNQFFCQQYVARYVCTKNVPYTISGNRIKYEGIDNYYSEWKIVDDKLELITHVNIQGRTASSKSIYVRVSPPTSPDRQLPGPLKANIELVKSSENGICLQHKGGDVIYPLDIRLIVDGQIINEAGRHISFRQFKPNVTGLFNTGEAFVLPGSFKVGSKVSIQLGRIDLTSTSPLSLSEPVSWTIDKLVKETPINEDAPYALGFASCP